MCDRERLGVSVNRHINIRHECVQNKGKIEKKMEGLSRSQKKNAKSKASFDFLVYLMS